MTNYCEPADTVATAGGFTQVLFGRVSISMRVQLLKVYGVLYRADSNIEKKMLKRRILSRIFKCFYQFIIFGKMF
jgi:hypothetical protein